MTGQDYEDAGILRMPPHAAEAEQAVLGGLMLATDSELAWERVGAMLSARSFYRRDHQQVWNAIETLAKAGQPLDAVTVGTHLAQNGSEGEMQRYVVELATTTPSVANVRAYAELVRDAHLRRQMIDAGTDLVNRAFDDGATETAALLTEAQQRLAELQPQDAGGMQQLGDSLREWWDRYQERYHSADEYLGLPTPWANWNQATSGLIAQEVLVLAGRPSMGKSVAGFGLANHAAIDLQRKVGVFSLETRRVNYLNRLVAAYARVPYEFVRNPRPDKDEDHTSRIAAALRQVKAAPLFVDDTPSLTAAQFETRARTLARREGQLGLIVVDHLHEFRFRAEQARFDIGEVVAAAKRVAGDLDVPVVLLSQLNRNVTGRADRWPHLGDLRESGDIEQKADVVAMIHREDYYDATSVQKGMVGIRFVKGRDIRAGQTIWLRNRFDESRLEDWDDLIPELPAAGRPARKPSFQSFQGGARRSGGVEA